MTVGEMTLGEQLDALRQIVSKSSGVRLLDLALINAVAELADAVEELSGRVAAAELGRV